MKQLDARAELLSIWTRWARVVSRSEKPWGDVRNERNCVIDAELLLCFFGPEGQVREFNLYSQSTMGSVRKALKDFDAKDKDLGIPMSAKLGETLLVLLEDFFERYSLSLGTPKENEKTTYKFESASYISRSVPSLTSEGAYELGGEYDKVDTPDETLNQLEFVDAFAFSALLCVRILLFYKRLAADTNDILTEDQLDRWADVRDRANDRLSEAMRGLIGSFAVLPPTELPTTEWQNKVSRTWPENLSNGDTTARIREVRDALRSLGVKGLGDGGFFECGWSWGMVSPAKLIGEKTDPFHVDVRKAAQAQVKHAIAAPYFYFTVTALDAIAFLTSEEVSSKEVLADEQLSMAARLRNLADITRRYWSLIAYASENESVWAIEQVPWRPADGLKFASEYWNLYLLRLVYRGAPAGREAIDRLITLLSDLARRARITQDPFPPASDAAIDRLHATGFAMTIEGDLGRNKTENLGYWTMSDFSPQLLKACGGVLGLTREPAQRDRILNLIAQIWQHLERRTAPNEVKMKGWDNVPGAFPEYDFSRAASVYWGTTPALSNNEKMQSWYITERVVEALLLFSEAQGARPQTSDSIAKLAIDLIAELQWRVGGDRGDALNFKDGRLDTIRNDLARAREKLDIDPAFSLGLAMKAAQDIATQET